MQKDSQSFVINESTPSKENNDVFLLFHFQNVYIDINQFNQPQK